MRRLTLAVAAALLFALRAAAGTPIEVARGEKTSRPQQPQLAVDDAGKIHLVYGVNNSVRYCRSEDGGASFSKSTELPTFGSLSLGMRRGPRVAVSGQAIAVVAIGGPLGKGRDGNVMCYRSVDGGVSWSDAVIVNDVENSAREGLHALAATPDGSLCCVWLDLRQTRTEVMAAKSVDGGATWTKNVLVYQSPDGSVCECCHPSIAMGGDGDIYVMWRNSLAGNRDMYLTTSTDGAESFGKAIKLGTGTWPLDACPMDGGSIASGVDGVTTVWRREDNIYLLPPSASEERRLGEGEQPWVTASAKGPYVAWLKNRGQEAFLLSPGNPIPGRLAERAWDPVVTAGPNPNGPVVAAWEGKDESGVPTIMCQVVGP